MRNQPDRADGITHYLVVSVVLTNCLSVLFALYEILYNTGDTGLETAVAIAQGMAASLAISIIVVSTWEVLLLPSEKYRQKRFNQGKEEGIQEGLQKGKIQGRAEGRVEGRTEGRAEELSRVQQILEQSGIELTPEVRKRMFGDDPEGNSSQG